MKKGKKKQKKNSYIENILSSRSLIVVGILFLLTGLYTSYSPGESNSFINSILNFFKPSQEILRTEGSSGANFMIMVWYFLPAVLSLILSIFYGRKFSLVSVLIIGLTTIYLIGFQLVMYKFSLYTLVYYYPNFYIALIFLFAPIVLLAISSFMQRNFILLIFTCLYFYITELLYIGYYPVSYLNFFFISILFFSVVIAWLGEKLEKPNINIINFIFVVGFFSMVFIKKFVVNSKLDYVPEFITFSILFYMLQYGIVVFASGGKEQSLKKWMQWVIPMLNLLFLIATTSFLVIKFYSFSTLWVFLMALIVLNVLGLIGIKKYNSELELLPYHYILAVLVSLLLPLFLPQYGIFLFASGLSVSFILLFYYLEKRNLIWISWVSIIASIATYFFQWLASYLPNILEFHMKMNVLWEGLFNSLVLMITLGLIRSLLVKAGDIAAFQKWKSRKSYIGMLTLFLLIIAYITLSLGIFILIYLLFDSSQYAMTGLFVAGSIYFNSFIRYYSGKQSDYKKTILYLGFLLALLYPLFMGWSFSSEHLIHLGAINSIAFVLHYIGIGLLILLGYMSIKRIYLRNVKKPYVIQIMEILTVFTLVFLFCMEYDNLSLLNSSFLGIQHLSVRMFETNQYLPYTVVILILSILVFFYGMIRKSVLLRSTSIILFVGCIIKLFAYDFEMTAPTERSLMLISMGVFLIGIALFYPRFKTPESEIKEQGPRKIK
jgi:hypothetical protein